MNKIKEKALKKKANRLASKRAGVEFEKTNPNYTRSTGQWGGFETHANNWHKAVGTFTKNRELGFK